MFVHIPTNRTPMLVGVPTNMNNTCEETHDGHFLGAENELCDQKSGDTRTADTVTGALIQPPTREDTQKSQDPHTLHCGWPHATSRMIDLLRHLISAQVATNRRHRSHTSECFKSEAARMPVSLPSCRLPPCPPSLVSFHLAPQHRKTHIDTHT